jgi:hypothetical protein
MRCRSAGCRVRCRAAMKTHRSCARAACGTGALAAEHSSGTAMSAACKLNPIGATESFSWNACFAMALATSAVASVLLQTHRCAPNQVIWDVKSTQHSTLEDKQQTPGRPAPVSQRTSCADPTG